MTYEVEIGGRTRRVEVERAGSGLVVTVDGRRHAADVTVINGVYSLLLGDGGARRADRHRVRDRKSTRLNYSHLP